VDYIAGNSGENSFYKGTKQNPVSIYAKDFDNNGVVECIPAKYIKDKGGALREYTTHNRDDIIEQMPFIRKRFPNYKLFAEATIDKLFTPEEIKGAFKLQANYFKNAFIRNNGNGSFEITALPMIAQLSCINGMIVDDFDKDGNLDVLTNGNDYGTEVATGRNDAFNGLVLKGDGKGAFSPLSILQSGWFVPCNAKALVKLKSSQGKTLVAASQNKGSLKMFSLRQESKMMQVASDDEAAVLFFDDGRVQKQEFNYGSSFLSQSARFLNVPGKVKSITVVNTKGIKRVLKFE
jgi:hypothetical protein